jgi:6-phosphogluconate dehydrogenase (decarboxylating)
MIHNGIEYGIMAAYAEGLNILRHANVGADGRAATADTAPLESPASDGFAGRVSDSGEGGEADFADKVLSAMRSEFGGHAEQRTAAA